jgi:fucose 4-O-acetylase-like acetyltransferase
VTVSSTRIGSLSDSTVAPTRETATTRDQFLDLLRAVSICRVVLLHTLLRPPVVYLPWIMWIYPGMPEVFFVSGAVTKGMLDRRRPGAVITSRVRRIAVPYAVYAAGAVALMALTDARSDAPGATFPWSRIWHWFVPLLAPTGSTDRVFLWGQLWYIGAFLWLVLAAPILRWLFGKRTIGSAIVLIPLVGFVTCLWLNKRTTVRVDEAIFTACQFGVFFAAGFSYPRLRTWSSKIFVTLSALAFSLGLLTARVIEPIQDRGTQELYASRTGHLLIGAGWMLLAFAAQTPIRRRIACHGNLMGSVVGRINQRTLTMYLWGLAANGVGNSMSRSIGGESGNLVVYLLVSALSFALFVVLFGWIEDVAAKRRPRAFPVATPQ